MSHRSRSPLASPAGLLSLALVLRLLVLALAGADTPATGDELAYQQIAANVAAGRGLYQTNNPFFPGQTLHAWQAPLYPFVLGAIYWLAGPSLLLAKLFGVLVSTATVALVYDVGSRAWRGEGEDRSRRAALAAGLLVAIYPGFLTNAHVLLTETLFTFFVMLAFACAARAFDVAEQRVAWPAWPWIAAAGIVWGLATLTRGITLYFTPLLACWIGWCAWQASGLGPARRGIAAAVLLGAAAFAVIAPYTVRNHSVFGQFVLLETKGGVNLWLGNSPHTPSDFIRNVWKAGVREPMLEVLPRDELERDRAAYALALRHIGAEPLTFLARMPIKFADFWGFERYLVDNAETTIAGGAWHSPVKLAADLLAAVVYVFVMLSGVAGFVYADGDRWKVLLGAFAAYFVAVHLVIFGDGRFHLPLIPLFALYAGRVLAHLASGGDGSAFGLEVTPARTGVAGLVAATLIAVWAREAWAAWQILRVAL